MALPKVCGIETEYGIVARGTAQDPISASSFLINSYVAARSTMTGWDFQDESPGNDARGVTLAALLAPEIETTLVNTVLTNGARYYVDHAHPEISTPEVRTAREAVQWDRAADEIIVKSMMYAKQRLGGNGAVGDSGQPHDDGEIVIYKNNSDGKGNSYGCHENYLVDRSVPFATVAAQVTPHFVTRQVFCGAGKVGSELPGEAPSDVAYQISQRADFFEEPVGLETTLRRPIVNTRDEPHCNPDIYRRLHVIIGDANMSEVATYLKVGTTSIMLAMIEDGAFDNRVALADPVRSVQQISHDPSLRATVRLADGRAATALDIQRDIFDQALAWAERYGLDAVGEDVGDDVLQRWGAVLDLLVRDPDLAASTVDWVAKGRLVRGFAERHQLHGANARLKAIDLQYHDLRPERSLAARAGLEVLIDPAAVAWAVDHPPESTRAYFRGRCLEKYPDSVVSANWDSIVFDTGDQSLRRVPMMEPLRGTAAHVAGLIDTSDTAADLVQRLEQ